ncbi:alpha-ketoglutarate-dependent dioxygenase AlkB [Peteryoungia desertarenae]|uniref:Alpha-ketoglutarate-dependent dioxygenase AlkB n=2 Tax=Peteryoungia desertarenae TaxID=1813451 RepID=A0ABX6QMZ3_9HYPH|nr:alpha-ketoglutarate-dependent dioxygenase AlkB [Peteryoungia desertarenae]
MEIQPHTPPGASLIPAWLPPDVEAALMAFLDAGLWSGELKRRVQHFGYRYDYRARIASRESRIGPLPGVLEQLARRLAEEGLFGAVPDQVIANEYWPGQGISAHVDCQPCFGPVIASVSLLSACQMVFRHQGDGEMRAVVLPPRSVLVLGGPARHDWTHEIPARLSDVIDSRRVARERRVSLTFRSMRF